MVAQTEAFDIKNEIASRMLTYNYFMPKIHASRLYMCVCMCVYTLTHTNANTHIHKIYVYFMNYFLHLCVLVGELSSEI